MLDTIKGYISLTAYYNEIISFPAYTTDKPQLVTWWD